MKIDDKIREKLLQVRLSDPNFGDIFGNSSANVTCRWYVAHTHLERQRWEQADKLAEMAAAELWGTFRPAAWPETPNYPKQAAEGVKPL